MTKSVDEIAAEISTASGIAGSIRIFGDWFGGRPRENIHLLVRVESDGDLLKLAFDAGEHLTIWQPRGLKLEPESRYPDAKITIDGADRVLWEWFYYGRPQTAENLRFLDYRNVGNAIQRTTNWEANLDWRSTEDASKAALELY